MADLTPQERIAAEDLNLSTLKLLRSSLVNREPGASRSPPAPSFQLDINLKTKIEPNAVTADGQFGIFFGHTFIVTEGEPECVDGYPWELTLARCSIQKARDANRNAFHRYGQTQRSCCYADGGFWIVTR